MSNIVVPCESLPCEIYRNFTCLTRNEDTQKHTLTHTLSLSLYLHIRAHRTAQRQKKNNNDILERHRSDRVLCHLCIFQFKKLWPSYTQYPLVLSIRKWYTNFVCVLFLLRCDFFSTLCFVCH